jgi:hypothetical protein
MVGNGTGASARSNALEVLLNGDVVAGNEIIDGQGNTLSVLAEALTKTASGNPVVITHCAGGKARSLITEINAIQDLHGYDHPWVGGSNKNLLPMRIDKMKGINQDGTWNGNTYTHEGVTYTLIPDETGTYYTEVRASGTATGRSILYLYKVYSDPSEYDEAIPNTANQTITFSGFNGTGRTYAYKDTSWHTVTNPTNNISSAGITDLWMDIANGTTTNFTIKPQIELGSSATSYAPYSNICPISGRTAAVVDDTGRNIWDEQWEIGGIDSTTGQNNNANNCIRCVGYISVIPTQSIYLKFPTGSSKRMVVHWYDQNKNYIAPRSIYDNTIAVTVPSNAYYMRFYMTDEYGTTYGNNISVNYPSTFTDYVPYAHTTVTIQLGQTVYGADIDWNTGVATVKTAVETFDGSDDETWDMTSGMQTNAWHQFIHSIMDSVSSDNSMSNIFEPIQLSDRGTKTGLIQYTDRSFRFALVDNQINITSVEAWRAWLASNPLQVEYKLATPIELTLTPTAVQMLKGYNRVTIDNGSIEVGYIAKLT